MGTVDLALPCGSGVEVQWVLLLLPGWCQMMGFVSFLSWVSSDLVFSWQAPREALAQTVLAEVPTQLVSYFKARGWPPFKPLPPPGKGPAQTPPP